MNKKLILAAPCLAILTACGGSSDGSAVNPVQSPPVQLPQLDSITNFPDGRTYTRITAPNYTAVALVKDPNFDATKLVDVEIVNALSATQLSDGAFSGTYVIKFADGSTTTASGIGYDSQHARMFMVKDNLTNAVDVSVIDGSTVVNMPSGTLTYTGHSYFEYSDLSTPNDWYAENGSMTMIVNLDNNSASISANADYSNYNASGLNVNSTTGAISGTTGTYVVLDGNGAVYSTNNVSFDGNLTGANAEYVGGAGYRYVSDQDYQLVGVIGKR